MAAAAAVAVVAGSWIAIDLSRGGSDTFVAKGSDGDGTHGTRGPGQAGAPASASSAAELTLVAMLDDVRAGDRSGVASGRSARNEFQGLTRTWLSGDRLGGSDAARLAAPVLRTQGAALDDIESELGAILGVGDGSLDATGGSATEGTDGAAPKSPGRNLSGIGSGFGPDLWLGMSRIVVAAGLS